MTNRINNHLISCASIKKCERKFICRAIFIICFLFAAIYCFRMHVHPLSFVIQIERNEHEKKKKIPFHFELSRICERVLTCLDHNLCVTKLDNPLSNA